MKPQHEDLPGLLANWRAVTARAEHFFDGVLASQRDNMQCGPGCDACCQQDLELLPSEALALLLALEALPPDERDALASRAADGPPPCALLQADGRCALYGARPLICRTHGLPILYREEESGDQTLSLCHLNFVGQDPPAEAVLDGTLLTAALTVSDGLLCQELKILSPGRVPISVIVSRGWDSFPGGGPP